MIKKMNNMLGKRGQTSLILILLAAAGLIFYAITLNWGRVAQNKVLLSIAADQTASLLASDAASYGEMEKSQYLGNTNRTSGFDGLLIDILMIVVAVVATIFSFGSTGPAWLVLLGEILSVVSVVVSVVNLALQLAVVQPGITALWNKLQKNQPVLQQFYEQGVGTALQGIVGDQVNVTDYFDLNTNTKFGLLSSDVANDTVGRFAFFYTDRLKMLNQKPMPNVQFFYDQLGEFINGESCAQNEYDASIYPNISVNPSCLNLGGPAYCITYPTSSDPACQSKIPNGFQLNDSCAPNSDPSSSNYTPYCDPCCQPLKVLDPLYNASTPNPLHPNQYISVRPANCPLDVNGNPDTSAYGAPAQCWTNNPYNSSGSANSSTHTLLYDPNYQNYSQGISFLAQYGRDQQMGTFSSTLTPQGDFPNGIFPFFWLMKDYSPEVDKINQPSAPAAIAANASYLHWCNAANSTLNGITIPASTIFPSNFADLNQLSLSYTCHTKDCCVNYLPETLTSTGVPTPPGAHVPNWTIDTVGSSVSPNLPNPVLSNYFAEGYPDSVPQGSDGQPVSTPQWIEGDDQMCLSGSTSSPYGLPYNGKNTIIPDGTCEWTGSSAQPSTTTTIPATFELTSQSTVDGLDDVEHTLSDFITFSNSVLNQDVVSLSNNLTSWYPQAANWIAPACNNQTDPKCNTDTPDSQCTNPVCNPGVDGTEINGRLLNIYYPMGYPNIPGVASGNSGPTIDVLSDWNTLITKWLANSYTSASAWCLPPTETAILNGNASTSEDSFIKTNSNNSTTWGDLPHVLACLNYNSGQALDGSSTTIGPVINFQQCQAALSAATASTCNTNNATITSACDPKVLGRSLLGTKQTFNGNCSLTSGFGLWVTNSLTLAADEAPKFALRAQFLNDVYTRATTMQSIFQQSDAALHSFLMPCGGINLANDPNCSQGGPAAQLIYARTQGQPASNLPNAVIYGWQDKLITGATGGCLDSNGHQTGCAHIVKVTAYSPGRNGVGSANAPFVQSQLPWINTWENLINRYYALAARDGYVYVSVKRWDEDHGDAKGSNVNFPNKNPLWQFFYHKPSTASSTSGGGLPGQCTTFQPSGSSFPVGWGLTKQTVLALNGSGAKNSSVDQTALDQAFMLNDNGSGGVDPSAGGGGNSCGNQNSVTQSSYCSCLSQANSLLQGAPESHACAEYIASSTPTTDPSIPSTAHSQNGDHDYTLRFVDCKNVPGFNSPDDLTGN